MSLQLLTDVCHVLNAELKQEERSGYVSCCDTVIDEVCEDEHNVLHDDVQVEKAQLINDEDVEDSNMLITSFRFTDLLILSELNNLDSLQQIHNCICQSLNEMQNAEQNTLDRTTYKIQSNQEHDFYIFIYYDNKFLE